jgi:dihydrofolate reductase
MRKVTLGLATSLDNYIARRDGGYDWIQWNEEVADISAKFMKTVDALLIGRKTYEVMLAAGQTSYPGAKNYVFTRSQRKRALLSKKLANRKRLDKNIEVVTEDAAGFVKKLKRGKGKGIVIFGGGELAKSLFEADLIDEVVLNLQPVILGSGVPLFHKMNRQIELELVDSRTLKTGGVAVSYRIKR